MAFFEKILKDAVLIKRGFWDLRYKGVKCGKYPDIHDDFGAIPRTVIMDMDCTNLKPDKDQKTIKYGDWLVLCYHKMNIDGKKIPKTCYLHLLRNSNGDPLVNENGSLVYAVIKEIENPIQAFTVYNQNSGHDSVATPSDAYLECILVKREICTDKDKQKKYYKYSIDEVGHGLPNNLQPNQKKRATRSTIRAIKTRMQQSLFCNPIPEEQINKGRFASFIRLVTMPIYITLTLCEWACVSTGLLIRIIFSPLVIASTEIGEKLFSRQYKMEKFSDKHKNIFIGFAFSIFRFPIATLFMAFKTIAKLLDNISIFAQKITNIPVAVSKLIKSILDESFTEKLGNLHEQLFECLVSIIAIPLETLIDITINIRRICISENESRASSNKLRYFFFPICIVILFSTHLINGILESIRGCANKEQANLDLDMSEPSIKNKATRMLRGFTTAFDVIKNSFSDAKESAKSYLKLDTKFTFENKETDKTVREQLFREPILSPANSNIDMNDHNIFFALSSEPEGDNFSIPDKKQANNRNTAVPNPPGDENKPSPSIKPNSSPNLKHKPGPSPGPSHHHHKKRRATRVSDASTPSEDEDASISTSKISQTPQPRRKKTHSL